MCGIAGIVGAPAPAQHVLIRMAQAMAHRGPDDEGIWSDDGVSLVFRRLAIIDLDPRSNQPLHYQGLHLAFNGEIYNYRELREELRGLGHDFVTEGDAEVLLHAWSEWGESALDRLNAMFAFAIWSEHEQALTLAADPFGEKPIYFCQMGEQLVFASDIRALREAVDGLGRANESALRVFVSRNLMPPPESSFFDRVQRLPAARVLHWRDGQAEVFRYWTPRSVAVPPRYSDAVEELRHLLVDSIRLRLRSDVPVGTSLSGGVDSATVLAMLAQLRGGDQRHAFTASFPGYERDEWTYAHQVAQAAHVAEHHTVRPNERQLSDDLEALVRDLEEPFGSTSIYAQWRVMKAARDAGIVVLLDGQGADELFGGYPWIPGVATISRGPRAVARALLRDGGERESTLRALVATGLPGAITRLYHRRLVSPYVAAEVAEEASRFEPPVPVFADGPAIRRELLSEAFVTSLPTLLRYADRSSMAHAREVRLPFLDRRVAEFAFSMPANFFYHGGMTKRILRDAAIGMVPPSVLARRDKVAFEPPQQRWLSSAEWRARIADVLLDRSVRASGLYEPAVIEADLRSGKWRDHGAVWRAFCAELWRCSAAHSAPQGPRALARRA